MISKLKCFFGWHDMQEVKVYDNYNKRKVTVIRTHRKCSCCSRRTFTLTNIALGKAVRGMYTEFHTLVIILG